MHRIHKKEGDVVSNQWRHNTEIAAEAVTILDLVTALVNNLGVTKKGRLKVYSDCKVTCDILTLNKIKESQLVLDVGSIISKIV